MSLNDPKQSNPVLAALKIKSDDKIIFVRENSFADSNFVITHLLKQLLLEKSRICFLTIHNTFDHYRNVGKKLGYDLNQAVDRGQVKIIDPLEELVENIIGFEIHSNEESRSHILDCLFTSIKTEITNYLDAENHPVYLVIDDLSHFLDLGIRVPSVVHFTNLCINLTSDMNVFTLINSHVSSKGDLLLANNLQYVCDVYVCVSSLKTGNSTDITGTMIVRRGPNENRYHYRVFDRGVKTFHPGETIYNLYK